MGYNTEFKGSINITPPVSEELRDYINLFSLTRHMRLDTNKIPQPVSESSMYHSQLGVDGMYYAKNDLNDFTWQVPDYVLEYNTPPAGVPSLWCHFEIDKHGRSIQWNHFEKTYAPAHWINFIIEHFLQPNGHRCDGKMECQGEVPTDRYDIRVINNSVQMVRYVSTACAK